MANESLWSETARTVEGSKPKGVFRDYPLLAYKASKDAYFSTRKARGKLKILEFARKKMLMEEK